MRKKRKPSVLPQLLGLCTVLLVLLLLIVKTNTPTVTETTAASAQTEDPICSTSAAPTETAAAPTETAAAPTQAAPTDPKELLQWFMDCNGLTADDYPERILQNYWDYPEARPFVLNYPLEKDKEHIADLSGYDPSRGVPLFLQWDPMWGYQSYGTSVGGISGCGPTCLAMVAYYWTGDPQYHPGFLMDWATQHRYVDASGGTGWALFSRGAAELGFSVEELGLDEGLVKRRLDAGIPIVISIKAGLLSQNGHYVVLVEHTDGGIRLNDPNSRIHSERLWSFQELAPYIRNLWAISLPAES